MARIQRFQSHRAARKALREATFGHPINLQQIKALLHIPNLLYQSTMRGLFRFRSFQEADAHHLRVAMTRQPRRDI